LLPKQIFFFSTKGRRHSLDYLSTKEACGHTVPGLVMTRSYWQHLRMAKLSKPSSSGVGLYLLDLDIAKKHSEDVSNIEQYSRRDCVEKSGLSEESDEDTNALTNKVGSLKGVKINESDISVSHRLPLKRQSQSYSLRLRPKLGLYQILLINVQKLLSNL
jgi:hypothetical protein